MPVKVNKLSSTKTQLPYDYYYLNYCKPDKIVNSAENLGEVLRGDRIENSVYTVSIFYLFSVLEIWIGKKLFIYLFQLLFHCLLTFVWLNLWILRQFQMRKEQSCQVACKKKLNAETAKNFKEKIDDEYRVNM